MKFLFFNLTVVSAFYYLVIATPQGEIPSATDIVNNVVETAGSIAPKVSNFIKKNEQNSEILTNTVPSVISREKVAADPVPRTQTSEPIVPVAQRFSEEENMQTVPAKEGSVNEISNNSIPDDKMQQHEGQQVSVDVNMRHKLQILSDEMEDLYLSTLSN